MSNNVLISNLVQVTLFSVQIINSVYQHSDVLGEHVHVRYHHVSHGSASHPLHSIYRQMELRTILLSHFAIVSGNNRLYQMYIIR